MQIITALLAGLVFGIGLILSGMTDPSKVIGFLDLAGNWDPSLAMVMVGAIMVGFVGFRIAGARSETFLGEKLYLPTRNDIDPRLVIGAAIFGVGWGLGGYCPGPALTSLGTGGAKPVIFVLAMVAGMAIYEWLDSAFTKRPAAVARQG